MCSVIQSTRAARSATKDEYQEVPCTPLSPLEALRCSWNAWVHKLRSSHTNLAANIILLERIVSRVRCLTLFCTSPCALS